MNVPRRIAKVMKILPNRLVIYLSKMVVNKYLDKYANITVLGSENLVNSKTPTLFICNHLSNADGLVLERALKSINPTFVAGVKLSGNDVTNIGINVVKTTTIEPNTADREGIKKIIELIKQGESLLIFPEGTRSRVGSLIEAKKGILLIAKMTNAPIIPLGVYGTEKLLPVNKDGDMSAENFCYADVTINIGKQFEFPMKTATQDKKEYEAHTLKLIMNKIAELLPEAYRGIYK